MLSHFKLAEPSMSKCQLCAVQGIKFDAFGLDGGLRSRNLPKVPLVQWELF